jgi:hypothetical protein
VARLLLLDEPGCEKRGDRRPQPQEEAPGRPQGRALAPWELLKLTWILVGRSWELLTWILVGRSWELLTWILVGWSGKLRAYLLGYL